MTIKILVNGAHGRMGQLAAKAIAQHEKLSLVASTSKTDDLQQAIQQSQAQVVVDFTHPQAVFANAQTIIAARARPVIGTSGLQLTQIANLKAQCAKIKLGGIIAPNFSLSAVLMMKYAQAIAKYIPEVEIIEYHHQHKADSPSATALYAAEMLTQARDAQPKQTTTHETIPGARGANYQGIPIHAIRLPGLMAHLQIMFGNAGETLTLQHDTIDRAAYMPGVCLACEKVMELHEMVYGLEHVL